VSNSQLAEQGFFVFRPLLKNIMANYYFNYVETALKKPDLNPQRAKSQNMRKEVYQKIIDGWNKLGLETEKDRLILRWELLIFVRKLAQKKPDCNIVELARIVEKAWNDLGKIRIDFYAAKAAVVDVAGLKFPDRIRVVAEVLGKTFEEITARRFTGYLSAEVGTTTVLYLLQKIENIPMYVIEEVVNDMIRKMFFVEPHNISGMLRWLRLDTKQNRDIFYNHFKHQPELYPQVGKWLSSLGIDIDSYIDRQSGYDPQYIEKLENDNERLLRLLHEEQENVTSAAENAVYGLINHLTNRRSDFVLVRLYRALLEPGITTDRMKSLLAKLFQEMHKKGIATDESMAYVGQSLEIPAEEIDTKVTLEKPVDVEAGKNVNVTITGPAFRYNDRLVSLPTAKINKGGKGK